MTPIAFTDLLAQLPDSYEYVSWFKLVTMVVVFTLWCCFAQWVDKDASVVNTWRVPWNLGVMGAGFASLVLWLFVPLFWIGTLIYAVINGVVLTAYVVHRNGLVTEDTKVFTVDHVKRLMAQGLSGKRKQKDVKQRVALRDAAGAAVTIPEEPEQRDQYALVQDLIFDTLWRRASLVEVVPAGQATKVTCEIDGISTEREPLARPEAEGVLTFIKRIAGLNLDEKRKPQTGRFSASMGEVKVTIVAQTGGSTAGEKLELRVLGRETEFKIDDLGFTPEQLASIREVMHGERGLTLVSGPPGSGVTVTIYSLARSHDAFLNNIQSLEVNKEYTLHNITQRAFEPSEERTYSTDIQKIVRTDPDVIFLPQPLDAGGAKMASEAATGKQKVYTTLPGDDVIDALRNWTVLVNEKRLLAKSLCLVINQRLVRKLCTECREAYKPDAGMLRKANLPADKVFHRPPEPQYDKHGNPIICQNCQGTGYTGRTGVFDVLVIDEGLRTVIRDGGALNDIRAYLIKQGAAGLQQQALTKVLDGTTSIQEVIRVTRKAGSSNGGAAAKPRKPRPTSDSGTAMPTAR